MTSKNQKKLANQVTNLINTRLENKLKSNLQKFFKALMNKTLVAFDEYYLEEMLLQGHINLILAPVHEAHQEYYELLLDANLEMFHRGEDMAERLVPKESMKAAKPVQFLHDNEDKYTQHFGTLQFSEDYLADYTFTASEATMQRVDSEINKILTTGYQEGWGVKDVRNRIMERYQQFQGYEANRIARTEMQTAHNMGMMNKYQELGVDYIEWRSAHDRRTRRSHSLLDGEIVKLGDKFSNGLLYPGDKSGSIEEWINCRCSAVPYLMRPGTSAPIGQTQFRADDLVSVSEPNYGKLLQKETGGALNWQQYKQVLHGKPLEQVLAGATIVETQQKKKEKPKDKSEPVTEKPVNNLKSQLEPICDTIEEAEIITKTLNKFAKEAEGLNHEIITVIDHNGNKFHNKGERHSVNVPFEAQEKGKKNGLLLSVHNHPNQNLTQSIADIKCATNLREKYAITYSSERKEFLLLKNSKATPEMNKQYYDIVFGEDINTKYKEHRQKVMKRYKNSKEYKKIKKDYGQLKISKEEFAERGSKIYSEYRMKNLDKDIKDLNKILKEQGVEFIRIKL